VHRIIMYTVDLNQYPSISNHVRVMSSSYVRAHRGRGVANIDAAHARDGPGHAYIEY
jgi:hypothetical protein